MKAIKASIVPALLCAALVVAAGCGSGKAVTRLNPTEVVDLSGRWNDTDSRMVAEDTIADCLSHQWLTAFKTEHSKDPAVIVGAIRNRGLEHIPVATFITDLEREFINSGRVRVVASAQDRSEIREERIDQKAHASLDTVAKMGQELGASFMLTGEISTIEDREGGQMVIYYQVDLTLTHIETNEKKWIYPTKIKKLIKRKKTVL